MNDADPQMTAAVDTWLDYKVQGYNYHSGKMWGAQTVESLP